MKKELTMSKILDLTKRIKPKAIILIVLMIVFGLVLVPLKNNITALAIIGGIFGIILFVVLFIFIIQNIMLVGELKRFSEVKSVFSTEIEFLSSPLMIIFSFGIIYLIVSVVMCSNIKDKIKQKYTYNELAKYYDDTLIRELTV